jgi:hypothetical protein
MPAAATDDRLIAENSTRPIDGALERLAHVRGIFYEHADDARSNFGPGVCPVGLRAGISAQALEAVFPQAVERSTFDEAADGSFGAAADEEGGGRYLTVRHDLIVPLLIEALRERGEIVAALERRVSDLEYRVRQIRR